MRNLWKAACKANTRQTIKAYQARERKKRRYTRALRRRIEEKLYAEGWRGFDIPDAIDEDNYTMNLHEDWSHTNEARDN